MAKLKLPDGASITEQLDKLSENEVSVQATTKDGRSADVRAEFQHTTERGTEIAAFGEVTVGAGRPKNARAGVVVRTKLKRKKR